MRIKDLSPTEENTGDERTCRRYIWWPIKLGDETRWLEYAEVLQRVVKFDVGGSGQWGCYAYRWVDVAWQPEPVSRAEILFED